MKKQILPVILTCLILISALPAFEQNAHAESYMSNKTEIPVDLEVSGAEALCQTDDGYVWIAQYSGLTRYDSKEFVTYKNFEYEGQEYSVINVRALASDGSTLYVATSEDLYAYKNSQFIPLAAEAGIINDIILIVLWSVPVVQGSLSIIPVLLCPILLLINDIYGVYNWKRIKQKQTIN